MSFMVESNTSARWKASGSKGSKWPFSIEITV